VLLVDRPGLVFDSLSERASGARSRPDRHAEDRVNAIER